MKRVKWLSSERGKRWPLARFLTLYWALFLSATRLPQWIRRSREVTGWRTIELEHRLPSPEVSCSTQWLRATYGSRGVLYGSMSWRRRAGLKIYRPPRYGYRFSGVISQGVCGYPMLAVVSSML